MKELDFIKRFKELYACGIDKSKSFDIYSLQKEINPFRVCLYGNELGCV